MPPQSSDITNLSTDAVFSHNLMQQPSYDPINNINLEMLSSSVKNENNLYYHQNYNKDNIFHNHNEVQKFGQQSYVLADNNQMNKQYHNDQPSTSSLTLDCQHQNESNKQLHRGFFQDESTKLVYVKQESLNEFSDPSTSALKFEPFELQNKLHENLQQHHDVVHEQQQNYEYQNLNYQHHIVVRSGDDEKDFVDEDDDLMNEDDKENTSNVKLSLQHSSESITRKDAGGKRNEEPQIAGGFVKPSYSYSCLITLALKNSSNGELTVSEIYAFLW